MTPDGFERPEDFDLAEYWERSVSAYQDSLPSFEAVIRVGPAARDRLEMALGAGETRAALAAAGEPDDAGWLTLRVRLEDMWRAVPQLLMLGPEAEVVAPPDLRNEVAAAAREMARLYA